MTLNEAVENLAKAMATQASANILVEGAKELVLKIGGGGAKAKIRPKKATEKAPEYENVPRHLVGKCPDCGHPLGGGHSADCKYEEKGSTNDYED